MSELVRVLTENVGGSWIVGGKRDMGNVDFNSASSKDGILVEQTPRGKYEAMRGFVRAICDTPEEAVRTLWGLEGFLKGEGERIAKDLGPNWKANSTMPEATFGNFKVSLRNAHSNVNGHHYYNATYIVKTEYFSGEGGSAWLALSDLIYRLEGSRAFKQEEAERVTRIIDEGLAQLRVTND